MRRRGRAQAHEYADPRSNRAKRVLVGDIVTQKRHPRRGASTSLDVGDDPLERVTLVTSDVGEELDHGITEKGTHAPRFDPRRGFALRDQDHLATLLGRNTPDMERHARTLVLDKRARQAVGDLHQMHGELANVAMSFAELRMLSAAIVDLDLESVQA